MRFIRAWAASDRLAFGDRKIARRQIALVMDKEKLTRAGSEDAYRQSGAESPDQSSCFENE